MVPPSAGPESDRNRQEPRGKLAHKRILAVVNPVAGPRSSERAARDLVERAGKMGVQVDIVETDPGDVPEFEVPSSQPCPIVMGQE